MSQIKSRNYLLILLIAFALPWTLQAQVLSHEIEWSSSKSVNLNSGDTLSFAVKFVSKTGTVDMIQGDSSIPFFIQSSEGTWSEVTQSGILTCQVKDESDTRGVIILGHDSRGLYIIVDMTPGNPEGVNRRFVIDSYQVK